MATRKTSSSGKGNGRVRTGVKKKAAKKTAKKRK